METIIVTGIVALIMFIVMEWAEPDLPQKIYTGSIPQLVNREKCCAVVVDTTGDDR